MEELKPVAKSKASSRCKCRSVALIVLLAISFISAIIIVVLVFTSIGQKMKIDELNNKIEQLENNEEKTGSDSDIKYLTYTTEKRGLVFDYPDNWVVRNEVEEWDEINDTTGKPYFSERTTITTAEGYEIGLFYGPGGIGGHCNPDDKDMIMTAHKEADGEMAGLRVVSYQNLHSGYTIALTSFDGPYDEPLVGECEAMELSFSRFLSLDSNDGVRATFGNITGELPSDSEYPEVVKLLSSLR